MDRVLLIIYMCAVIIGTTVIFFEAPLAIEFFKQIFAFDGVDLEAQNGVIIVDEVLDRRPFSDWVPMQYDPCLIDDMCIDVGYQILTIFASSTILGILG